MWTLFVLMMLAVCLSIFFLLRRYADKRVSLAVRITTAYAWLTSMWVVALVPLDAWQTLKRSREKRADDAADAAITVMWDISYWSTQVLTWLVLPFFQIYADAGDFTVMGKCWTSLKENMMLYGLAALAGVIGFIILLAQRGVKQLESDHLESLGITMSNTFGLVAGILLLGYGLVQLPRWMFKSRPESLLKWSAHRAGRLAEQVLKTTKELDTVVTIIYANQRQMPRRDPLRVYMDLIAQEAEDYSPVKPSQLQQRNVDLEGLSADDLDYNYDKDGLARLRRRLFQAVADYKSAHAQYESAIQAAFELEDVVKCRSNGVYLPPSGQTQWWARALWGYRCLVHHWAVKGLALVFLGLGFVIVWCECVIPVVHPDLSVLSIMIRKVQSDQAVQLLVAVPLAYVCVCTYYALFSLNAFNYNRLTVNATTGAALMQNASLMARFAAPTCWNYFHMIRLAEDGSTGTSTSEQTQFSKVIMGQVTDGSTSIGFFNHLNVWLPIILVVHCTLVAANVFDRIANMCVPARYKFSGDDDVEDTYTEKGRALIRREQEAVLRGFRVGEVLHSEYLDLDNSRREQKAKKGWFSWMGRSTTASGAGAASAAAAAETTGAGGRYGGAAGGAGAPVAGEGSAGYGSSLRLPFMSNKHTPTPSLSQSADSATSRGSGLDGIFASVQSSSGRAGSRPARIDDNDDDRTPLNLGGRWR